MVLRFFLEHCRFIPLDLPNLSFDIYELEGGSIMGIGRSDSSSTPQSHQRTQQTRLVYGGMFTSTKHTLDSCTFYHSPVNGYTSGLNVDKSCGNR